MKRKTWIGFGGAFLLLAFAGCEAAPPPAPGAGLLAGFETGAPQDEVLAAFPDGGFPDDPTGALPPVARGYYVDQYFHQGMRIEVVWLHDSEAGYPEDEFRRQLNPVIFVNEALDGWGWEHFDLRSDEWGIAPRTEPEEEEEVPADDPDGDLSSLNSPRA